MDEPKTDTARPPVRTERRGPAYWRVTFDNPPLNLYDPETEASLAGIVDQLEADPDVKVVVFDSALPDFFMAHLNLGRTEEFGKGMPTWFDLTRRLGRASFITVASIRGCARGIGNELLMALDLRFASRENAILGQLEIGTGIIPGCGGMQRLWRLTGRARALEIIASGEDYDADTAERYGWINRAVPDAALDAFVERFAQRIVSFDSEALVAIKEILNEENAPPTAESLAATNARFNQLLARDSVQQRLKQSAQAGLETILDLELNMGERIGPRSQTTGSASTGQ
ncbi:MAG TPA: enoyl-CoA hydratase/isomerase family protein [Solirubrobacteraceae bacterium]